MALLRTASDEKGMTLVEIMVAVVLGLIILTAVYMTFLTQQKSYIVQSQAAEAQQNGRIALDTIVRSMEMAGFGVTGSNIVVGTLYEQAAFDFSSTATLSYGSCRRTCNSAGGNGSDEIVFASRDPRYQWDIASATEGSSGNVVFKSGVAEVMTGTVLFLVAASRAQSNFVRSSGPPTNSNMTVNLLSVDNDLYDDNGSFQSTRHFTGTTFGGSGQGYRVNYYHFYLDWTDAAHPVLMLDDGTTGTKNPIPIAANIEDLQIAFDVNGTWYWSNGGLTGVPGPQWNVRAVRVGVVARSDREDLGTDGCPVFRGTGMTLENHTPAPLPCRPGCTVCDGYRRRLYQATVYPMNLASTYPRFQNNDL